MIILFKTFLILALAFFGYFLIYRVKVRIFHRAVSMVIGLGLVILIIYPDLSTRIANFFGVGRGVDFLFYCTHIFFFYLVLLQYLALQEVRRDVRRLVQELALKEADLTVKK